MASFITRALDKITPWNRGGEVQRNLQAKKKKKDDEQNAQKQPSISRTPQPSQQTPKVQRPENLFQDLNQNIGLGQNKPGVVSVNKTPDSQPVAQPKPGTVVKPSIPLWKRAVNDVGNVGSAAAGAALGTLRAGEGLVQGVVDTPDMITHAATYIPRKLAGDDSKINRGLSTINRGVNIATKKVKAPVDWLAKKTDEAALGYGPAARTVYKPAQIGANIATVVPGLTEGAAKLATIGKSPEGVAQFMQDSKLGQASRFVQSQRTSPILAKIDELLGGRLSQSKLLSKFMPKAEAPKPEPIRISVKTPISVRQDIPITSPTNTPTPINVRNLTEPRPVIRELSNDVTQATPDELIRKNAQDTIEAGLREKAWEQAKTARPDQRIQGVTPRTNEPFKFNPADAEKAQAKIVQDYADTLKNQGEGNGVNIVSDGEGGYKRVSDNVRTAETKGKRMTKAAWRDEAARQLQAGEAEAGHQTAFNDAVNPEVQSLIAKGEPVDMPAGRPITVQQAKGISVRDETVVPTGLPEKPGTVRVTKATAPTMAKSEAAAAQPAPMNGVIKDGKFVPNETPPKDVATATAEKTLPASGETDENFLKRVATDTQSNIKRAVDSLKMTKKMTKAQRAEQAARGQSAYEAAKAAGLSPGEQEAARKTAMRGSFDRQDYVGSPIHSEDEQRLRDMVDEHYKDMPYQAGNVREAFGKLFHAGEPGYQSETHIIPSDIKNIRKFLNESVPNPDGNGGLGDFAETAIKELADADPGPGKIANAIGLQRALRFTADISATGRQALPGALSHPVEFAQAAKKSFEVMFSHEKYQKLISELSSNKEANYINDRLGAYLSVLNDDISKADDIYRNSAWAHKIPGVKQVVAASERQYNTILSMMRYYGGKRFIDAAGGIGNLEKVASDSGDAEAFLKAIGTVTNVNTGRGFGKALDTGASKILSDILVSPRGLAARVQRFNPKYYIDLAKTNPAAAKEAARSLAIQTGLTVSAMAAANKAGMFEDGQIKVGNTRYDITGGIANMVRTATRVAQFMTGHRETTPFNDAETEVTRWFKNQLSPFIATALNEIGIHPDPKTGEYVNKWGEPVTGASRFLDYVAPVNVSQVNQDLQLGTSPVQTAANAALNTTGVGVNTYVSSTDKKAAANGASNSTSGKTPGGVMDYASFKAQAPKEGFTLQQLDDGSYAYSIKGKIHQTGNLRDAREAIAKAGFADESGSYKVVGDKVYRKNADGEVSSPISKTEFDYKLGAATLTSQKRAENLDGWMKTANSQLDLIEKRLNEPNIDPVDKITLQNEADALIANMQKYKSYGGFTKGKGGKSIDTSFGTLKASQFAPKVQQYDTIDTKSGSVPHIGIVRPNIVHKISSSG